MNLFPHLTRFFNYPQLDTSQSCAGGGFLWKRISYVAGMVPPASNSPIHRSGNSRTGLALVLGFLLGCASISAQPIDHDRMLYAIAQVETGNNPRAIGRAGETTAWQLTPAALREVGRHGTPKERAQRFLILCEKRLIRAKVEVSPARLGLVWNVGFKGARARKWKPNDYARRVANLYTP